MMEYDVAMKTFPSNTSMACDCAQDRIVNKQDTKLAIMIPVMVLFLRRRGWCSFTYFSKSKAFNKKKPQGKLENALIWINYTKSGLQLN